MDVVGSYIVGATIAKDGIEQVYKEYPILEEIAELGAELETIENDELYRKQLFRMITLKLDILKKQLNSA